MPDPQLQLTPDRSAAAVLHELLATAERTFPGTFTGDLVPGDLAAFRKRYPEVMPKFEAERHAGGEGPAVAGWMCGQLQHHIWWRQADDLIPLHDALGEAVDPLPLRSLELNDPPGWAPQLVYRGERWQAADLGALGERLAQRNVITVPAARALQTLATTTLQHGRLQLTGRKVALLGAAAEMAPTRLWLAAGADVLWLDRQPPSAAWLEGIEQGGRLFWPEENADLLHQPQQILATLEAFADGQPLDLGLYAYAPGKARELLLTASMNAIVNALPGELIGSVAVLVSPTTPTRIAPEEVARIEQRLDARPAWETLCARLGLLGRGGGLARAGAAQCTRSVVGIQGASYQAAQYLGKVLMAEHWASHGQLNQPAAAPLRVSANTAAITRTRSLDHPVFAAAFGGAAAFGVETLVPEQSRRLNGLLTVQDWFNETPPQPGAVRVHGGIHTLPYPLQDALKIAAAIGFARSPRLLRGLLK